MGGKKKSIIEKVVMGAIIGTAVGSVIGLTVAPKKGEETRQYLNKEIKKLTKETVFGIGTLVKNLLFGRKKEIPSGGDEREHKNLKKIPLETEVQNTFDHSQE